MSSGGRSSSPSSGRTRLPERCRSTAGSCAPSIYAATSPTKNSAGEYGGRLNKGESLHALRRDLFFAHQGHVRRRHLNDQVDQALCLTLVTNAAVLWTTTYLDDALNALRANSYPVTDEAAPHLTPAQHDHINFYGTYSFDVETELRRQGHRPLRSPAA